VLERISAALAGADANYLLYIGNPQLAITD
jgi:hypothetical protein